MRIGDFLASKNGKRLFNFAYCWGACFVIAGAVCKIINLPNSTALLILGMIIEVIIFFLAAFETQPEEYKWERVYPKLKGGQSPKGPSGIMNEPTMDDVNAQLESKVEEMVEQMDIMSRQLTEINAHYARLLDAMNKGANNDSNK
ncbi:MAG: gliding motility protein GldL [Rikenellaceae bacterium]